MSSAPSDLMRASAAAGALVLAVLSRGDVLVLAALLVLVAWRPAAIAVVPAVVAAAWRWGSTSFDALAGAQAVLGPAGFVGPASAAAASWLAALTILVGVPGRPLVGEVGGMKGPARAMGALKVPRGFALIVVLATGAAVAAVVAGPGLGGELWIRFGVGAAASVGAVGVVRLRARADGLGGVLDGAAVLAGIGAVVAASRSAPAWAGTVDGGAVGEGVIVALAVAIAVVVGTRVLAALPERGA